MPHGFAGFNKRGKMHDGLWPVFEKNTIESRAVGDVADNQFRGGGQRSPVTVREVIENNRLVTASEQLRDNHTSDISRAASDHYSLRHAFAGLFSWTLC